MDIITGIISPSIALIPTLLLVWKTWERKKTKLKIRLIRQKGRVEEVRLKHKSEKSRMGARHRAEMDLMETRHKAEMDRELLKLDILEREMKHEAELKNFEVGLERQEEKDILEKNNPLTSLKQKGENFFKDKMDQVKEKVSQKTFDSLNKVSQKFTSLSDEDKSKKD